MLSATNVGNDSWDRKAVSTTRSRASLRARRGFAYAEVIIAVFVTAIGAAATLSLLNVSSEASRTNQYYTIALRIASTEIETVRATKACLLANRTGGALLSSPSNLNQLPGAAATLDVANSATLAGAKDIAVTVRWNDPITGGTKSVVLKTMVSANGPTS